MKSTLTSGFDNDDRLFLEFVFRPQSKKQLQKLLRLKRRRKRKKRRLQKKLKGIAKQISQLKSSKWKLILPSHQRRRKKRRRLPKQRLKNQ